MSGLIIEPIQLKSIKYIYINQSGSGVYLDVNSYIKNNSNKNMNDISYDLNKILLRGGIYIIIIYDRFKNHFIFENKNPPEQFYIRIIPDKEFLKKD